MCAFVFVCGYMHECSALRGQKEALDPLELGDRTGGCCELPAVGVGTEAWSARAASALNHLPDSHFILMYFRL